MTKTMLGTCAALLLASSAAYAQNDETQWDLAGDLSPTFGTAFAQFVGDAELYAQFDTTTGFGIPDMFGGVGDVMFIEPPFQLEGNSIAVSIGSLPNAGGIYVNEYTLIFDLLIPQDSFDNFSYFGFYNTNATNSNDGDAFIRFPDGGIGISGVYEGAIQPDTWHRVAFTWSVNPDTGLLDFSKYIDGVQVGVQAGLMGVDGRWAMYSANDDDFDSDAEGFWILADNDVDEAPAYISSMYYVDRAYTEDEILALGGPHADGATTPGEPANPPCDGDLDGDGDVDQSDLGILLANYGCGL